jgi:hypothetical protein
MKLDVERAVPRPQALASESRSEGPARGDAGSPAAQHS